MNQQEIERLLKPKVDALKDREQCVAYSSAKVGLKINPRLRERRRTVVRGDIEAEAYRLGISASWLGWLVLKWVISRLVNEVLKEWDNARHDDYDPE
jgi:hypothetical protein